MGFFYFLQCLFALKREGKHAAAAACPLRWNNIQHLEGWLLLFKLYTYSNKRAQHLQRGDHAFYLFPSLLSVFLSICIYFFYICLHHSSVGGTVKKTLNRHWSWCGHGRDEIPFRRTTYTHCMHTANHHHPSMSLLSYMPSGCLFVEKASLFSPHLCGTLMLHACIVLSPSSGSPVCLGQRLLHGKVAGKTPVPLKTNVLTLCRARQFPHVLINTCSSNTACSAAALPAAHKSMLAF